MDPFTLKITFMGAIISRMFRHYKKSKQGTRVETYLPEGIKFLLTWLFIYLFTWVFVDVYLALVLITNKIIG